MTPPAFMDAGVDPGPWAFAGTTTQVAGLFPFGAGSGAPGVGVPVGHHAHTGEPVCCDPFAWHEAGLVTNLGMMVLGAPGAGKTSLAKRIIRGLMAAGTGVLILGDPKGEYVPITRSAGGQVIRIGRGLDRINPLDAGPLTHALPHVDPTERRRLLAEIRGHRLGTLTALCALLRGGPVADWEAAVLGAALDALTHTGSGDLGSGDLGGGGQPTVGDVLAVLTAAPAPLVAACQVDVARFERETTPLRRTLYGLLEGPLKGVFDAATTTPLDLTAPIVCVDLSAITATTDALMAAAMLATWSHGHAVIDATTALTRVTGTAPRRYLAVLDEMWRALRGSPALVEHADALTRIYRHKGVAHLMLTHSLDDLAAVADDTDRAKARGLLDRCAITALTAMSDRELDHVNALRHLTSTERHLVASWSSAATWTGTGHHPARGHYLLKAGDRPGIPVQMTLVGDEAALYDTDPAALP
ncbi:MAG: DUF87 domain-containing protein [Kineosporiaceae bacterium]|nr:DUF87 domain-containing protein [Kineosporiaceae bacterium]